MAYAKAGSTAGANPPVLAVQPVAFGAGSTFGSTIGSTLLGGRLWVYVSTHTQVEFGTSDFITDAQVLGMKPRDVVMRIGTGSGTTGLSFHVVTAVGSTYASLTAGLIVSSAS